MNTTNGEKIETFIGVKIEKIGGVYVEVWNSGSKRSVYNPAILMIHGMFGGGWYFESWAKFLCDNGFVVYVIKDLHEGEDLRKVCFHTYVGKSTKVVEAICATTSEKVVLLGHSMGGLIAQEIAEINSHLVAGLVLVASAPPKGISAMSWSVARAMLKHFLAIILNFPLRIDRKSALKLILSWLGDKERKEQLFKKFVPESSMVAKQLAFSRIPIDERKIVCKSLVVSGLYDRLLPNRIQANIADKYDSHYLSFLSGHMPMLENNSQDIIKNIYRWIVSYVE